MGVDDKAFLRDERRRRDVEVLVAGGGPAGLVAAQVVAASGHRVLVCERQDEIGTPVHTSGAISIDALRQFGIPASLYHPVSRIRLCSMRESAVYETSKPVCCVLDVHGMYRHLAQRAEAAGAEVATGTSVTKVLLERDVVIGGWVSGREGQTRVTSKVVVDASGYRAEVSKAAGLHRGFERFGVGAEYELVAPHCCQDELVLVMGERYAPAGYAWVFPWGQARVRVGVGLLHSDTRHDPRRILKVFCDEVGRFGVDLRDSVMHESHFGLIPATGLAERIAGSGILAVGDAAGVATLVVGEGIRPGMISGREAGMVIARCLAGGRGNARALGTYEARIRAIFGSDARIGGVVNRVIATWGDEQWDEAVRALRHVPAELLFSGLQSEFSTRALLRWVMARPVILPRVARLAMKALRDGVGA